MSWGEITDEGLAEAAALIGAPLRRSRMQWIEEATRDAIRHFAWAVGDDNPLWLDREYAARSPTGGIVAPPCLLYAVDSTIVAPKLAGVQWIYAGTDWTWFDHVRLGDVFRVEAQLTSQEVKSGRRFDRWALQSGEIRYLVGDRVVGTATGHCARTPRGGPAAGSAPRGDPPSIHYTPEALEAIEAETLAEPRRGGEPLFWEDVNSGDRIPAVVKGPLTSTDVIAWYAAFSGAQHYGGAHGNAVRYRRRHADYHVNPRTGAKDSAGRGHLEADTGRHVGMGGAYDIGPQRIAWGQHMLTNWIGDHGFLHRLSVSVRAPNLLGNTTWWRGTVTAKRRGPSGACLVDLEVKAENQRDEVTALGRATVALPSRAHGPVSLPLAPEV